MVINTHTIGGEYIIYAHTHAHYYTRRPQTPPPKGPGMSMSLDMAKIVNVDVYALSTLTIFTKQLLEFRTWGTIVLKTIVKSTDIVHMQAYY